MTVEAKNVNSSEAGANTLAGDIEKLRAWHTRRGKGMTEEEIDKVISSVVKKVTGGGRMKKIGAGLIGNIFLYDENHVLKIIKKDPQDRYGRQYDRKIFIENERRAIEYDRNCKNDEKLFPETVEIKKGQFLKEKLYECNMEDIPITEKIRFATALIKMLKNGFGFVDGVQMMVGIDGRLNIYDADSFITTDDISDSAMNSIAYVVNTTIARKLGIGKVISQYCNLEKTIKAFKDGAKKIGIEVNISENVKRIPVIEGNHIISHIIIDE